MPATDCSEATCHDQPTDANTGVSDGHQVRWLRRPVADRKLAGVAAAIAEFLGIDVTAVRMGFIVLGLLGGSAVPLYAAGWLLIPEEGAALSIGQQLFIDLRHRWAHPSL